MVGVVLARSDLREFGMKQGLRRYADFCKKQGRRFGLSDGLGTISVKFASAVKRLRNFECFIAAIEVPVIELLLNLRV